jgi:hypothetical protein
LDLASTPDHYLDLSERVSADYLFTTAGVLRVLGLPRSGDPLGSFRPLAPSFMRLVAGTIVLYILETIVLGFQGLSQTLPSSSITISNLIISLIGFVASIIVFRYGTELSNAAGDAYDSFKNFQELLNWIFQIAALYILYTTTRALVAASGVFRGLPWAYPMIFAIVGLIPTVKVVVYYIHKVEGGGQRHT